MSAFEVNGPPASLGAEPTAGATRIPLGTRIFHTLVQAIRSGEFPDGRLPPEDQLARMFGVSRTTVRRTLQSLEQIGIIERRPGRGTRLRTHADLGLLALHGLIPFPTLLRELGHEVSVQVSWRRTAEASDDDSARLGQATPSPIYEINIVVYADGSPAVVMRERLAEDNLAREPTDEDLHAGSILILSDRCFRQRIDHAVASLRPVVAPQGNPLGLPSDQAMLVLDETFLSKEEVPVAISEVRVHPEFITFSVFRQSF